MQNHICPPIIVSYTAIEFWNVTRVSWNANLSISPIYLNPPRFLRSVHYFPKCASQNSSPKRWYFVKCWKLYSMFLFWRVTLHITIFVSKRLDIKGTFWSNVFQTPLPTEFSARNKIFHQESARKSPYRVARGLALSGLFPTPQPSFLPTPRILFCSPVSLKSCFSVLGQGSSYCFFLLSFCDLFQKWLPAESLALQ